VSSVEQGDQDFTLPHGQWARLGGLGIRRHGVYCFEGQKAFLPGIIPLESTQ